MSEKYKRLKIKCLDNGLVFNSIAELARTLNVDKGAVTNYFKRGSATLKGLRFVKLDEENE